MEKPLKIIFNTWDARQVEVINFYTHENTTNAVLYMPDNKATPWIVAHNVTPIGKSGWAIEWAIGDYFKQRYQAERKFYEITGAIDADEVKR